jgi:outer membrane protein W
MKRHEAHAVLISGATSTNTWKLRQQAGPRCRISGFRVGAALKTAFELKQIALPYGRAPGRCTHKPTLSLQFEQDDSMKKALLVFLTLLCAPVVALAGQGAQVYAGGGTLGVQGGLAMDMTQNLGMRVEMYGLGYAHGISTSDVHYNANLQLQGVGAYLDYFPAEQKGVRLTTGVLLGDNKITAHAKANQATFKINGHPYDATGQWLDADAEFDGLRPYFGIGYGHNTARKGLGFFADVGFAVGKPNVSLTASPQLAAAAAADIQAERKKVQDKLNQNLPFGLYPVISVGIS